MQPDRYGPSPRRACRRSGVTRPLRLAALAAALVAAGCGATDGPVGGGDPPGSPDAQLRADALAAGLAPIPEQLPADLYPTDNPKSADKTELGHELFFDPIMSGPKDVACSTCHLPRLAFGDGRQFSLGAGGLGLGPERVDTDSTRFRPMPRNSIATFNVGLHGKDSPEPTQNGMMFWGGGAFGLEGQVLNPIAADNELRGTAYPKAVAIDSVAARLRRIPEYLELFEKAFPDVMAGLQIRGEPRDSIVSYLTMRRALAAYLRELITPEAPLDHFLRGENAALDDEQKAGLRLFIGKAGCVQCHRGPELSDFEVHVIGVPQVGIGRDSTRGDDLGHGENGDRPYTFRTAPLRQVALTSPYFHDGAMATLSEVIHFKNTGKSGYARVAASDLDPYMHPLGLTEAEMQQLEAFLGALTDSTTTKGPLFLAPARVPSGLTIPK